MIAGPAILIQASDPSIGERLATVLAEMSTSVWTITDNVPADVRLDLVVSDQPGILTTLGLAPLAGTPDVGLIIVGARAPISDVELPVDVTDREILLSCKLLADLVRWRREALHTANRHKEMRQLALTDPLTSVANRRAWDAEVPERLQAAKVAGRTVCLAVFDVDLFKTTNDLHGHDIGDRILAQVGKTLAKSVRDDDFVARLGGDEFAALFVGEFTSSNIQGIVERVRSKLGKDLSAVNDHHVTVSAGCALVDESTADITKLFKAADEAVLAAKHQGRDRTILASPKSCH
jgi:diguanylate cyclase (GGDEF)-like protein